MNDHPTYREPDERARRAALVAQRDALRVELAQTAPAARRRRRAFWAGLALGLSPLAAVVLWSAAQQGAFGPRFGGPNPEDAHYCAGLDLLVDLTTDPRNCGRCGLACPESRPVCDDGTCECAPGHEDCSDEDLCADLSSRDHCGGCGILCEDGPCVAGECDCGPRAACVERSAEETHVRCVDFATAHDHCGHCNHPCPGNATCAGGTCVCEGGLTFCDPGGTGWGRCVDTLHDRDNCGGCDLECPAGTSCTPEGACTHGP